MKLQGYRELKNLYKREEDFSSDLAGDLSALRVGSFKEGDTESKVGTRRADIVAVDDDGTDRRTLVIENQFGKADWDHWGRLEAYARLKEANVAVLVAERFEELMIVTCNLRNEDSKTDWYLIQAQVNSHDELSFHHVARPAIDIQTERSGVQYSEFWEPIRSNGLFAGKPVPIRDEGWIQKGVKGMGVLLQLHNHACSVIIVLQGEDRLDRRTKVIDLFPETENEYKLKESPKFANVVFPVLDLGKKDVDHWPEIRQKLTALGETVYKRISESDL